MPKNRQTFGHSVHTARAMSAQRLFSRCPTLGQSMPNAWSMSAHLMGKTDHLVVSDTAYVILFLIQLVNLFSYS